MPSSPGRWNRFRSGSVLFLSLLIFAALIRLPFILKAPGFEFNELQVTLSLARGDRFPLYNQRPHIGALANYINALAFGIFGYHYWLPRVVILLMGALTVAFLYRLGRRLTDSSTAFLASVLLAGSMYHVFEISHVSWSNSMTPFFTTLCVLSFLAALQEHKAAMMVLSGFLFGLSLQTHPSVITLLPALLAIFLLQGKERVLGWMRKPAPYLSVLAAMIGYANMIYYNINSHFDSVSEGMNYPVYSLEAHPSVGSYFHNAGGAWMLLFRLLSGAAEDRDPLSAHWLNPAFALFAAAVAAGVWLCVRKRKYELPLLLGVPMLIIPLLNRGYEFCKFGRYLGFLLPAAYLLAASTALQLYRAAAARLKNGSVWFTALWMALPAGYLAFHFIELDRTYAELLRQDQSMLVFRGISRNILSAYDRKQTLVLIDPYGWKAFPLSLFLQSDGWAVGDLAGDTIERSRTEPFKDDQFQRVLLQYEGDLQSGRKMVALVSPGTLKSFLAYAPFQQCNACLMMGPVKDGFYEVLGKTAYYLFDLSPQQEGPHAPPNLLLNVLLEAQPLLPANPEAFSKAAVKRTPAAHPPSPVSALTSYLKQNCLQISIELPEKKCAICTENITTKTYDNRHETRKRRRTATH